MTTANAGDHPEEGASIPPESAMARFEHAARLYAGVAIVLGLLGLIGWWLKMAPLVSVVPGLAPMQVGTSVGLVAAGACVLLVCGEPVSRVRRIAARLLSLYLIAWGGIVIWWRLQGAPVPPDGLLHLLFLAGPHPGTASTATGLAFLLLGAGLFELGGGARGMRRSQPIALTGIVLGVGGIAGYLYDADALYSAAAYNSTPLPGAIGFVLLFAAMLACRPRGAWVAIFAGDSPGNVLARRVLPVAILFPFVSGWIFLFLVGRGYVGLSFGVAALAVFSATLLSGIVWRTAYNVGIADAAQRGAARALRRSDQLRAAVFEAVLDPIVTLDRDGGIVEANMAARRVLGTPTGGGRIDAFFVPDMPPPLTFPRPWDEDATLNHRTETLLRRADGATFPAEISISQTWPDGRQTVVLHIRDLTGRKRAETQLRQAQKMEAVGQLTGGLAHDFNNLLAIVLGNLDLLSERLDRAEFKEAFVRPAIAAAERGSQLTQRLLAFGRRQSLQPAITDVNGLVEGMAEMLRLTLGQGVRIRIAPSPGLWPTRIDPAQLENALINLAANARDAMDGAGQLTIETHNVTLDDDYARLHPEVDPGAYIRLTVTDTGRGMPPEVAAHAFEPFFTTKEVGKGTGLGLSMVYGFIRQSGGHVRLYSEPHFGTAVALYLPRADGAAIKAVAPDPVDLPAAAAGELVLVVEDDPDMLTVTAGMVADLGYRTLTAADAAEARALLDAHADIDLLFTDLMLSGDVDGIALAEGARARRPDLKVAYTSGFAENALAGRMPGGDIVVLQKPFRRAELAQRLRHVLYAAEGSQAEASGPRNSGAEAAERHAAGGRS